jgi:xanthine dehydrogenase YagR molybdenum-binding subunit
LRGGTAKSLDVCASTAIAKPCAPISARCSLRARPSKRQARQGAEHFDWEQRPKVDPDLGQMPVTGVGAFVAVRSIDPRLVKSEHYGGIICRVSFPLQSIMDPRSGRVISSNLAEYRVPVSADVPSLKATHLRSPGPQVDALGIKGVGEIGISGMAGSVANAVWYATGIRVRKFPITLNRLIEPR